MEKNELEISQQREYRVVKANEIVQQARNDLTLAELKTFAYIVSKILPTDQMNQEYVFSIKEYCQVLGIDYKNGKNYMDIKKALKSLRDRSFWLMSEDGSETTVGWLSKARINRGSGKITVKFDEDIQKYVIGLYENYTQYSLLSTLPMQSAYSFRLFELLKSYAYKKQCTFEIDELKKRLAATHYKDFKDFRTRVLEIAIREINLYTEIETSWEAIRKGRGGKVSEIRFDIRTRGTMERLKAAATAEDQINGQISMFDYDYFK